MRKVRQVLGIDMIHNKITRGEGITIAILDSGICNHPDFENRMVAFKDMVNMKNKAYDDEGHGSHVAGIIAGNGMISRKIYTGIAPRAKIVSLKVLDNRGIGKEENVINGIRWIIDNGKRLNIRVVNISFGTFGPQREINSRLIDAVELLWDLGYVVVASAGNNGPKYNTITTPGDCKKIITVGAADDNIKMIVNGRITKNYSGRGPTNECIQKPDIVAPANNIYSCSNIWNIRQPYVTKSGTSMATPIVSGVICLLLSKNPELTNTECKKIIRNTAIDLKMDRNRQGFGLINPIKALNFSKN